MEQAPKRIRVDAESRLERVVRLLLVEMNYFDCLAIVETCQRLRNLAADYRCTLFLYDLHGARLDYSQEISLGDPAVRAQLRQNYLHWSAKVNRVYVHQGRIEAKPKPPPTKPWHVLRLAIKLDHRKLLAMLMERPETAVVLQECHLLLRYVYLSGSFEMLKFFRLSIDYINEFMQSVPSKVFYCQKFDWCFNISDNESIAEALIWYVSKPKAAIFTRVLKFLEENRFSLDWTARTFLSSSELPAKWHQLLPTVPSRYDHDQAAVYQLIRNGNLRCDVNRSTFSHGRCMRKRKNFYCQVPSE